MSVCRRTRDSACASFSARERGRAVGDRKAHRCTYGSFRNSHRSTTRQSRVRRDPRGGGAELRRAGASLRASLQRQVQRPSLLSSLSTSTSFIRTAFPPEAPPSPARLYSYLARILQAPANPHQLPVPLFPSLQSHHERDSLGPLLPPVVVVPPRAGDLVVSDPKGEGTCPRIPEKRSMERRRWRWCEGKGGVKGGGASVGGLGEE